MTIVYLSLSLGEITHIAEVGTDPDLAAVMAELGNTYGYTRRYSDARVDLPLTVSEANYCLDIVAPGLGRFVEPGE